MEEGCNDRWRRVKSSQKRKTKRGLVKCRRRSGSRKVMIGGGEWKNSLTINKKVKVTKQQMKL